MEEYDIFISYRRVGGADFARQMQLALKNKGYKVFLDFDELKDGVFDRRIEMAINRSKVFLFVLSPHALDRCKNEDDWVRREIECALISKCHIVPVSPNVNFEGFDDIEGLPYFIKNGLGQHQVSTVMMNDLFECTFEEFVCKRIANVVSTHQQALKDEVKEGCEVHIETDIPCYVFRFKERLIIAQPNDDNLIYLKKGSHKLTFMSTENENDSYSLVYAVKDDCEFLQVSLAKIRDARVAAEEEAERRAKEERKLIAEDDAKYQLYEENDLYGFKKDGAVVIPAKYDFADFFSEGLAPVKLNGKWGYIDKSGKEFIPLQYDNARRFSEGLAQVELNGKWGYINKSGKEVIPLKYDDASGFGDGLAPVKLNGKWGYIDKSGKEFIPLQYDNARRFSEGLAPVKLNGKWGYIDKSGKEFIPLQYDNARCFRVGLAAVELNGKWGYINKSGKEVIPLKYDYADEFIEGLAKVKLGSKYGFVDKSGTEVIPLKYDDAFEFIEGLAQVELNGKWGYINKSGKEVIPLKYDYVYYFSEGLAQVELNGKWGYINKSGKEVIPLKYDYVCYFRNGQARAKLNGEWGYIDKQGNFTPDK